MANVSIRMDDNLKKQAEDLFNDLGMNLTTAFTIFVKQAIREQGIPFEITREIPNSETISAINEVQQMKQNPSLGKAYTDMRLMTDIIKKLANGEILPPKNRDHNLSGNYSNCRECHIAPDWLLIYEVYEDELFLYLTRTGSHSDLF